MNLIQKVRFFFSSERPENNNNDRDVLTGLKNREALRNDFDHLVGHLLFVMMVDVDEFKDYNDKYGHECGDAVLTKLGAALQNRYGSEAGYRYGGDEFIVIAPFTDKETLLEKDARVRRDLSKFMITDKETTIRISCGYVFGKAENADELRQMIHLADQNLYRAKKEGRNTIIGCGKDDTNATEVNRYFDMRDYIVNHIQEAIDKKWIQPYYQPMVDSETGQICGSEALARWQDPKLGIISPAQFISALEMQHKSYLVDLEIIRATCEEMHQMMQEGRNILPVSFNMSVDDFQFCDAYGEIEKIRQSYEIPTRYLKLEIKEFVMGDVSHHIRDTIYKFHQAGYGIWVDNFGSSYASLRDLKDYDFDTLKINMNFASDYASNPSTKIILSSIVNMDKQLGIDTVIEGVETREQYQFLKDIGFTTVQGYYFSKPVSMNEITSQLNSKRFDAK